MICTNCCIETYDLRNCPNCNEQRPYIIGNMRMLKRWDDERKEKLKRIRRGLGLPEEFRSY